MATLTAAFSVPLLCSPSSRTTVFCPQHALSSPTPTVYHRNKQNCAHPHFTMNSSTKPPVPIAPELRSIHVLGLGMTGVDMLANVDRFPQPDEKVRTKSISVMGGGNTANAMTALRRLGVRCTFVSKVGDDINGRAALDELRDDGIDIQHIQCKKGINTSFVYVVVDKNTGTRTCLATICDEDLSPDDVSEDMLDGVDLLMVDGRHTLAAIQLAKYARRRAIPILLDIERERPHIRALVPFADYIVTNSAYPFLFAPNASSRAEALQDVLETFNAKFVISTLGSMGSMMVQRQTLREKGHDLPLHISTSEFESPTSGQKYEVLECPVWAVNNVVDTTGAGDAFIGAIAYGLVANLDHETMLCLASRVAAAKIQDVGSRTGLPRREEVAPGLLSKLSPSPSVSHISS